MRLAPGTFVNQYCLTERLGEGGMGVVFRAKDTRLERDTALKFLPPDLGSDDEARERLLIEARAASRLDHPNICTVYEVGETDDGRVFIAMGCYEGRSLRALLDDGPLAPERAVGLAAQIARGLGAAHAKGITHRDVKPSNVIVTDDGTAKLIDFGIAKVPESTLTKTGTTLGTMAYMAPEQTRGAATERSDLWALGVVLFEMLTGRRPFDSPYEGALVFDILYTEPDYAPLEAVASPEAVAVVRRCLTKDAAARYPSAGDVVADLERTPERGARPAAEPDVEAGVVAPVTGRRVPRAMAWAAAVVVVLLGGLAFALVSEPSAPPSELAAGDVQVPGSADRAPPAEPEPEPVVERPTEEPAVSERPVPPALEPASSASPSGPPAARPAERREPAPAGVLTVRVVPSGDAEVGGERRSGPARFSVPAGEHAVVCTHPSYGTYRTRAVVEPGGASEVACHFEATVRIVTRRAEGEGPAPFGSVWVNGANTGEFTPAVLTLGPGRHRITVRRDGYETLDPEATVVVEPSSRAVSESLAFRIARAD